MTTVLQQCARRAPRHESGFTLIEVMIAMAVGLFLIGGLLVIVQNVGKTRSNQALLAQLQDNQRVAMTIITNTVQAAGYFPDPTTNTLLSALPAGTVGGQTFVAGQALTGTYSATGSGDSLTVRFATASNDTVINCLGGTNTSGAVVRYTNRLSVSNSNKRLECVLNGSVTPGVLVDGLSRMDVRYGVKRNAAVDNNNVDTYMRADQVTAAAAWSNVTSVKVTLTFVNPLYGQPGQTTKPTIKFTRVIAVMSRTGVKL